MLAIYKRELKAYFYSPVAYVFMGVMLSFFGLFFLLVNIFPRPNYYGGYEPAIANFSPVLDSMLLVLLFVLPILVMRLLADERKQKTDQLLHTVPLTTIEIVFAKYLSAVTIFAGVLVISLVYPLTVYWIAGASLKYLIPLYTGFFLLGSCFIAICLFASGLTESQVVAATLGFFFILGMWLIQFLGDMISQPFLKELFYWFSLLKRFEDFRAGILTLQPIIYYLSVIIGCLFLSIRTIDKRRWTEG